MSGFDIILQKDVDFFEVKSLLSKIFSVPDQCIYVSDDYPEEDFPDDVSIMCLVQVVSGDFNSHLSIDSLSENVQIDEDVVADSICAMLNSDCLFPDETSDPLSQWLLSPGFPKRRIFLNSDDLLNGEYRVDEIRSVANYG